MVVYIGDVINKTTGKGLDFSEELFGWERSLLLDQSKPCNPLSSLAFVALRAALSLMLGMKAASLAVTELQVKCRQLSKSVAAFLSIGTASCLSCHDHLH